MQEIGQLAGILSVEQSNQIGVPIIKRQMINIRCGVQGIPDIKGVENYELSYLAHPIFRMKLATESLATTSEAQAQWRMSSE